jgi:hypothetical protein
VDVQQHRPDEDEAHQPQRHGAREDRDEQLAEELAVVVDVLLADEHLQVADHVRDDVAEADDPGDRHDVLLADRRGVEVEQEELAPLASRCCGAGDRPATTTRS